MLNVPLPNETAKLFILFFRQIFVFMYFFGYLGLLIEGSHISIEKKRKTFVKGSAGGTLNTCVQIFRAHLSKTAWTFGL